MSIPRSPFGMYSKCTHLYWFKRICKFLFLEKYQIAVCIRQNNTNTQRCPNSNYQLSILLMPLFTLWYQILIFFKQSACWATFSQQSVSTAAVLHHVQNCLSEGTAVSHLSLCVRARVCVEDVTLSLEGQDKAIDFTFGPLPRREVDTSSEYVCGCVYVWGCKIDNDKNEERTE